MLLVRSCKFLQGINFWSSRVRWSLETKFVFPKRELWENFTWNRNRFYWLSHSGVARRALFLPTPEVFGLRPVHLLLRVCAESSHHLSDERASQSHHPRLVQTLAADEWNPHPGRGVCHPQVEVAVQRGKGSSFDMHGRHRASWNFQNHWPRCYQLISSSAFN